MGLLDDLERIGQLRERGLLTDAEFHAAKAKLLGADSPEEPIDGSQPEPEIDETEIVYETGGWSSEQRNALVSALIAAGIVYRFTDGGDLSVTPSEEGLVDNLDFEPWVGEPGSVGSIEIASMALIKQAGPEASKNWWSSWNSISAAVLVAVIVAVALGIGAIASTNNSSGSSKESRAVAYVPPSISTTTPPTSIAITYIPTTTITEPPVTEPPVTAPPATYPRVAAPRTTAPPRATPTTEGPAGGESVSQFNARKKAASYLSFSAFSRTGLIDQLKYEGFSVADATYGVDAQNANWNQQAAKKAASYLSFSSFSHTSLLEQLLYEGFTQAQAEYGVSTTGL